MFFFQIDNEEPRRVVRQFIWNGGVLSTNCTVQPKNIFWAERQTLQLDGHEQEKSSLNLESIIEVEGKLPIAALLYCLRQYVNVWSSFNYRMWKEDVLPRATNIHFHTSFTVKPLNPIDLSNDWFYFH